MWDSGMADDAIVERNNAGTGSGCRRWWLMGFCYDLALQNGGGHHQATWWAREPQSAHVSLIQRAKSVVVALWAAKLRSTGLEGKGTIGKSAARRVTMRGPEDLLHRLAFSYLR